MNSCKVFVLAKRLIDCMCISFLLFISNIKGIEKKILNCALKNFVCAHRNSLGKLH